MDIIKNVVGTNIEIENSNGDKIIDYTLLGNTTQNTSILPDGYTQVDYIESSGTQYIDTGVNADYKLSVLTEFSINTLGGAFGAIGGISSSYIRHHFNFASNQGIRYYYLESSRQLITLGSEDTNKHKYLIDIYNKKVQVDGGTEYALTYSDNFDTGLNYWLFRRNANTDNLKSYVNIKLYNFKMYYEDKLVRDFVPCYRNSDNEVGLYDLVNNIFYTNQGTGAFTYGSVASIPNPDYPQEIEVVTGRQEINIGGKNLADYSTFVKGFVTANGSFSTNQSMGEMRSNFIKVEPNTTYTFSIQETSSSYVNWIGLGEYTSDNTDNFIKRTVKQTTGQLWITFTTTATTEYIVVSARNLAEATKVQLEKGSIVTSYEEYKKDIYEINLGKNLLQLLQSPGYTYTFNGITYTFNEDRTISVKGTATANSSQQIANQTTSGLREMLLSGKYFLSGAPTGSNNSTFRLQIYGSNTDGSGSIYAYENGTKITTFVNETANFNVAIWVKSGQTVDLTFKPMLEKGNQKTSFSPYKTPIELCKIEDYRDRISHNIPSNPYYDENLTEGAWYIYKAIGKAVLDGSEYWDTWYNTSNDNIGFYYYNYDIAKIGSEVNYNNLLYCDRFSEPQSRASIADGKIEGIKKCGGGGTPYIALGIEKTYLSDWSTKNNAISSLKTWLGNNNTLVYYPLATPTYTEITDTELISRLNVLENATLPYGIAYINVNGDLPAILDLNYYSWNRYISPEDRQAILDGSATIPFKINVVQNGTIVKTLDENSIVNLDYEDFRYVDTESIVIGQFVARKITGELDQIYTEFEIEDTELEVQMGISYNDNTNYYSLGNFLVTKPTSDEVKEKTQFESMDYTKKFNQPFTDTGLTFPCTALQLAQHTCNLCGVELATTDFANADFIIQDNQYVENDTCRKVMQDIGKLAYSWIRIDWDNKCYIDFDIQDTIKDSDIITNNEYYDLSLQKEVLGPVNRVVIGIRDVEGENAVIEDTQSIEENGVTEIQLYDNNLTYTPELRLQAIQQATRLFGLTYTPLETNTVGHPWLLGKEKIEVKDMNDNPLYTYPWDRTIAYNGHIKSKLVSKADTKTETEYKNYGGLESAVRQTRIIVDKQNQTIEALAEEVKPISNTISGVGSITLENAYEGTLHRLEIKGNISSLFPSTTLYPNNTLYPLSPILVVDDTSYEMSFSRLRYINSLICDLYVYEDGKQWVERNIGVDSNGNLYELGNQDKYIEELPDIVIQVSSNSTISLSGFGGANFKAIYLLQNDYTNTFATNVDVISKINVSPGNIAIQSHKIALEGYTTINGNFWVDLEGNMHARNGTFEGNIFLPNGGRVIGGDGLFSCLMYSSAGRWADWEIIGYGASGVDTYDDTVKYSNIYLNVHIPNNFIIINAYALLQLTSVNTAYSSSSGDFTTIGTPKELGLFKGNNDTTVEFFYYPYQAVEESAEYGGMEIENAFTTGRYTPDISSPGDVVTIMSKDIKDYFTVGEVNPIFVKSMINPKPKITYFTPSGASYKVANYKEVVENTGIGKLIIYIYGYMNMEENE